MTAAAFGEPWLRLPWLRLPLLRRRRRCLLGAGCALGRTPGTLAAAASAFRLPMGVNLAAAASAFRLAMGVNLAAAVSAFRGPPSASTFANSANSSSFNTAVCHLFDAASYEDIVRMPSRDTIRGKGCSFNDVPPFGGGGIMALMSSNAPPGVSPWLTRSDSCWRSRWRELFDQPG